jgi:hypothetical protein
MKYTRIATLVAIGLSASLHADVTLKQTTEGSGLGLSGKASATVYIKGNKMRTDTVLGDKTQSTIFDLDGQKMYVFDSKKKEADVWDMAAFGDELSKNVDVAGAKASMTPNGQTKQVAGRNATGYDVMVSVQSAMGGSKDLNMTVTLQGPMWVVKGAPGTADYANFYKAAVDKGWIFSDPRAAKAQPGQAKAMAQMYKQMAETGGIAYESNVQVKMGGSGPMAGLLARMGNVTMNTVVDSVETGPLADDLFAPPAGYKLNPRK